MLYAIEFSIPALAVVSTCIFLGGFFIGYISKRDVVKEIYHNPKWADNHLTQLVDFGNYLFKKYKIKRAGVSDADLQNFIYEQENKGK